MSITADAMQTTRDNARFLREVKHAHFLWPVLGNQPKLCEQLNALPWETAPVAAATSEISRGRIETRTTASCPPRRTPGSRTRSRPSSSSATPRTRRKASG